MYEYTREPLTMFEENAIADAAVSLFDHNVTWEALTERLEDVARLLDCTVAQLVATYVRLSLTVFQHTPRPEGSIGPEFDVSYARWSLREALKDSSGLRISFDPSPDQGDKRVRPRGRHHE